MNSPTHAGESRAFALTKRAESDAQTLARYREALEWVQVATVPRSHGGEVATVDALADFAEAVLADRATAPADCPYCRADGWSCPACSGEAAR